MTNMEVLCRIRTNNGCTCNWKGLKSQLLEHCKREHKYSVSVSEKLLAWKYKKIFSDTVNLLWHDDDLFWCHHRDHEGIMYWAACHITPNDQTEKFYYEVDCYLSGNPTKRMKLQENCISHETDLGVIYASRRCVAMPYEALKSYFGFGSIDILDQIVFTARIRKIITSK